LLPLLLSTNIRILGVWAMHSHPSRYEVMKLYAP